MSNVFFTSDTHFGHANIIKYCDRPFSSVEEMNYELIKRWNEKVQPGDIIYHLGDFGFLPDEDAFARIITRLNGNKVLIFGNHDKKIRESEKLQGMFGSTHELLEVTHKVDDTKVKIILCHYAMRVWNVSHGGSIHLYGHSHGTLTDDPNSLSMDVGVDTNKFYPYSLDEVMVRMTKKHFKAVDHHGV